MDFTCKRKEIQLSPSFEKENPDYSQVSASTGSVYVHVPFCVSKCSYCDFYSVVSNNEIMDEYLDVLEKEVGLHVEAGRIKIPLSTLFFGGGTPTSLGEYRLRRLVGYFAGMIEGGTEFTVEVNPGTVDPLTVAALIGSGVNRVSIGAQSFDGVRLKQLGRIHGPEETASTVRLFREGGAENISVDLMYALPDQSVGQWMEDLSAAVSLGVEHVSTYALSFEESTVLGDDLESGKICRLEDELQRQMYYEGVDYLESEGFEQYEISNFARPGRRCRHNMVYWRNGDYAGLGPAAAGFLCGIRWTNNPDLESYIVALRKGDLPPNSAEMLTGRSAAAETLMLALRLVEGVEIEAFSREFGRTPKEIFPVTVKRFLETGILVEDKGRLKIERDYLFTSNEVFADFLSEAAENAPGLSDN